MRCYLPLTAVACLLLLGACSGSKTPPDGRSSCRRCHQPLSDDGGVGGLLESHPTTVISCVDCHGGDGTAEAKIDSHVAVPDGLSGPTEIRGMSSVELDTVPLEYVRWVNPSDYRVSDLSCGTMGCHEAINATAPSSIMTTMAGHFNKPRYYVGRQTTRFPEVAARDQRDESFDGAPSAVEQLTTLHAPALDADSSLADIVDKYIEDGCPRCHVWNFGPNDKAGDFRSSGCAGCHMVYANDGLSRSADPNANLDDPPHPINHRLTSAIPDSQCEHCHYRGNRIGTMYRGVREAARLAEPPNIGALDESLHGRPSGFFVDDEDTTNDVDETPADIHQQAGMGCVDCHSGVDVHGDGNLYGAHDEQVAIECIDCHGTEDTAIAPDDGGVFRNSRGEIMRNLRLGTDGVPVMISRLDGEARPLAQLVDLDLGTPEYVATHGRDSTGFSHLDSLECYTCHTAWTQSCPGCHVTVDMRTEGRSLIDGTLAAGRTGGSRSWVVTDYFALGMGVDGQLTLMAPQEKMFLTAIVPCNPATETCTEGVDTPNPGRRIFDQVVRRTADGKLGFGFGPVVPHTTSVGSVPCDRCHLREDGTNTNIVNETLGRASGRFLIPDGEGTMYDLSQVVDDAGEPIVGLAHQGTGVVPPDVAARMLVPRVANSGLTLRDVGPWVAP
ncbi:MAG: cytochrome c3 family protein [Deltaproteobacteria bacterium]|nr:cytochrome c3 family protein [Deltaproteobacteria bacterium]